MSFAKVCTHGQGFNPEQCPICREQERDEQVAALRAELAKAKAENEQWRRHAGVGVVTPQCPACGADDVMTGYAPASVQVRPGEEVTLLLRVDTCARCEEQGDFSLENEALIQTATQLAALRAEVERLQKLLPPTHVSYKQRTGLPEALCHLDAAVRALELDEAALRAIDQEVREWRKAFAPVKAALEGTPTPPPAPTGEAKCADCGGTREVGACSLCGKVTCLDCAEDEDLGSCCDGTGRKPTGRAPGAGGDE